jgi:hypothetical protein
MVIFKQLEIVFCVLLFSLLLNNCSNKVVVRSIDLTKQSGLYVVAYSDNLEKRAKFENLLAEMLRKNDFVVEVSYKELPNIVETSPEKLISMAKMHQSLAILMIKPANRLGAITMPMAPPLQHENIVEYYKYQHNEAVPFDNSLQTVAEIHTFLVNENNTPLYWSGVTFPYNASTIDDSIKDVATNLTEALIAARKQVTN